MLKFVLLLFCIHKCTSETFAPYYGLNRPALEYDLPPLPYSFDGLEPYIDSETLRVHYLGHHSKYTENMNNAMKEWRRSVEDRVSIRVSIIDLLRNLSLVPSKFRSAIKNNGGGYVNHALYWTIMSPNQQGDDRWPEGELMNDLKTNFRSFIQFRELFSDAAAKVFGSGYVWLCRNYSNPENRKEMVIVETANQDCPLSQGLWPILVIDVWEHAYYLKHRNQRLKHIQEWWYLVDWKEVQQLDDWWRGIQRHDEL